MYISITVNKEAMGMGNKKVTLSVDSKTYDKYKKRCEEKGIILSKQFEIFIKKELKKRQKT